MPSSPVTRYNYELSRPERHYTERSDGTPAGWYTDHRSPRIQEDAYERRLNRETYASICSVLGLQHWHWAQRAVEQHALRNGIEMPRTRSRQQVRDANNRVATTFRRFGIEIEFNRGSNRSSEQARRDVVDTLRTRGIDCQFTGYTHETVTYWKMTYDTTVTGGELVSPIMSGDQASLREMQECVRGVKDHGCTTGKKVGMHVHHDITDFDRAAMLRLVRNIKHTQMVFAQFVPRHRYSGELMHGATLIREYQFGDLETYVQQERLLPANARRTLSNRNSGCPVSRYSSFNFNSVLTYGTVEFRLLGHTLNPQKIKAWIEVGQALMRYTLEGGEFACQQTPESMIGILKSEAGLSAWAGRRFLGQVQTRHGSTDLLTVS